MTDATMEHKGPGVLHGSSRNVSITMGWMDSIVPHQVPSSGQGQLAGEREQERVCHMLPSVSLSVPLSATQSLP